MLVLGLNAYTHESSACLLDDGKPLALVEEERTNREKHTWHFPKGAISEILNISKVEPREIEGIAFFWCPWREITGNIAHVTKYFPKSVNLLRGGSGSDELSFFRRMILMGRIKRKVLSIVPGIDPSIKASFIGHHLAHAASSFLVSPFEKSAILIIDGRGESKTTFMGVGEGNRIVKLYDCPVPHSLGHLYSAITVFLGFRPFSDEFKVMGLSAYGDNRFCDSFKDIVQCLPNGKFGLDLRYFSFHTHGRNKWLSARFYKQFGLPRHSGENIEQRHCDIAYALQKRVEDVALHVAKFLQKKTKTDNLVIGGGVGLNCLMNKRTVEESGFKKYFFQPIANDAGTSLGSGLYYTHVLHGFPRQHVLKDIYWGPDYQDNEIEKVLKAYEISYKISHNIAFDCAKYVAEGKTIGWFQGRMECGPRALGNRSIIADPRVGRSRDIINTQIKKREWFRPFAASVLFEYAHEYFDSGIDSPFMMLVAKVKHENRAKIPAVIHKDGTTRLQTVKKEINPLFWGLIYEFNKLTGVPVVLNTSFNENEPIVMTPKHAVNCFLRTGLDVLAIGNFLILKEELIKTMKDFG